MLKRLVYLTLQSMAEGQAAFTHVNEIIRGLERRGWRVRLIEPRYRRDRSPGLVRRLAAFAAAQFRLVFGIHRADILYVRWHVATLPGIALGRLLGIPIVLEVNGTYEDLFIAWPFMRRLRALAKLAMRLQFRLASAIIAVTPGLAVWVRKEARDSDVYVISNGADVELFHPKVPQVFDVGTQQYVVFVGALAEWQGVDTILDAVEHTAWPSDVRVVIAGDGALCEEIHRRSLDGVTYLGKVPYAAVPSLVSNALAAISVQTNPGGRADTGLAPLKVFEATACGTPPIVSDFPGQADLVRDSGCGLVIAPNEPSELAEAVAFLQRNPKICEEMGRRSRELATHDHSWDARAEETALLLDHLA